MMYTLLIVDRSENDIARAKGLLLSDNSQNYTISTATNAIDAETLLGIGKVIM